MSRHITAAVLLCSFCLTQAPDALAQQSVASTIIVPGGTTVPLTLVNLIKTKSTKPGDSIRALVAFPVTVDGQVAIPEGTYVEGTLAPPLPKVKHQPDPDVQIHLTRLVFANGYSATIDAMQARATFDAAPIREKVSGEEQPAASLNGNAFISGQTTPLPTLPPLHSQGPSPAVLAGVGIGVVAAITTIGLLHRHNAGGGDSIVHDAGWQFEMKLQAPLVLVASRIAPTAGVR